MLEIKNACFGYGESEILDDFSAVFPNGKVTAVIGPNGCGKSTLLKALTGSVKLKSGTITADGTDIKTLSPRLLAQRVACLVQSRAVPDISARHMVLHGRFPYLSYPRRYRKKDYAMADKAIKRAGAEGFADKRMNELSGGQRQRIYIAMALAQDTDTILFDEPATFLDMQHRLELISILRSLADEGKAVGVVLHDLDDMLRCADRAILMYRGRAEAVGTPEEIISSGKIEKIMGVKPVTVNADDGLHCVIEALPQS